LEKNTKELSIDRKRHVRMATLSVVSFFTIRNVKIRAKKVKKTFSNLSMMGEHPKIEVIRAVL
jgi:hypothetical protein